MNIYNILSNSPTHLKINVRTSHNVEQYRAGGDTVTAATEGQAAGVWFSRQIPDSILFYVK
jgi:hypothetical protein